MAFGRNQPNRFGCVHPGWKYRGISRDEGLEIPLVVPISLETYPRPASFLSGTPGSWSG
jgi:hypothetical protein